MPVGVPELVALWHGEVGLDNGYRSVWLAIRAAELLDPADEVVLIRRFYRRPADLPLLKPGELDDLEDVPEHSKVTLTLGYRFYKESRAMREHERAA